MFQKIQLFTLMAFCGCTEDVSSKSVDPPKSYEKSKTSGPEKPEKETVLAVAVSARCEPEAVRNPHSSDTRFQTIFDESMTLLQKRDGLKKEEADGYSTLAVDQLRNGIAEFPDASDIGLARFNIGVILTDHLGQHIEAIEEFKTLIGSNANDADPTGNLLFPYRNYRYKAFRMMAEAYSSLGRKPEALEAAGSAREVYCSYSESSKSKDMSKLDRLVERIKEESK